jgi:hypothetical protein
LYKRLHRALFHLPVNEGASESIAIDSKSLAELLQGVAKDEPRRQLH